MPPPEPSSNPVATAAQSTAERARAAAMSDTAADAQTVAVVRVDGYEILEVLGRGGMGVVYKAQQRKLGRVVALKTVLIPDQAPPTVLARFRQEAVSLAKLHHPNIVSVYDSGECEVPRGQAYFAMELLDGEDFKQRLDRVGQMPERAAWLIVRQTAAALAHAARHGIIHRDVKPANLFLVPAPAGMQLPDGVPFVKVTDFGIAFSPSDGDLPFADEEIRSNDLKLTATGALLGTPVYMAPEQFAGSRVDHRADIYSLGCTVYHALIGRPPFDGRTLPDVMRQKLGSAPRLAAPISAETADLVASMLALQADSRPHDYANLLARIDALPCLKSGPVTPRLPPAPVTPPAPVSPPVPEPLTVRPSVATKLPVVNSRARWLYLPMATSLLAAGVAVLAWALSGPDKVQPEVPPIADVKPEPQPAPPRGRDQVLFRRGTTGLDGWQPQGNEPWWIVRYREGEKGDPDRLLTLTGTGAAVRPFAQPLPASFRVTINLDPSEASTVDLVVATTPPPNAARWLIRIDRSKKGQSLVAFGKVGRGLFEVDRQIGWVPLPDSKNQFREFRYTRVPGALAARFGNRSLGSVSDDGLDVDELRVEAVGGPVFIEAAELNDLTVGTK